MNAPFAGIPGAGYAGKGIHNPDLPMMEPLDGMSSETDSRSSYAVRISLDCDGEQLNGVDTGVTGQPELRSFLVRAHRH